MISVKNANMYCCEDISKIENYDKAIADKSQFWICHHRLELMATGGVCDVAKQDLIDWGIYYGRPADELIFVTRAEHVKLHRIGWKHSEESKRRTSETLKGHLVSKEARRKISESCRGRILWPNGRPEETIRKITEANRGKRRSEEQRRKMSEAAKGKPKPWLRDKPRAEEWKRKLSEYWKGTHYFNNGVKQVRARECPEGFVPGRLRSKNAERINN